MPGRRMGRTPGFGAMGRPCERPGTWYSLIRTSLVEEAAGTVLTPHQAQSLMARLRAEHIFSTPSPDGPAPDKEQPPCPGRGG